MGQIAKSEKPVETVDVNIKGVPVVLLRFFDVCARNEYRSRNGQLLALMNDFVASRVDGWKPVGAGAPGERVKG